MTTKFQGFVGACRARVMGLTLRGNHDAERVGYDSKGALKWIPPASPAAKGGAANLVL